MVIINAAARATIESNPVTLITYQSIHPCFRDKKEIMAMDDKNKEKSPILDETLPHQMNFPSFKGTGIKMEPPFVNEHGVVIGDSRYNSENSPLNNWSIDVDPAIMAGDQWVHPTNDIGWTSRENQEILEEKKRKKTEATSSINKKNKPDTDAFMHPQFGIND